MFNLRIAIALFMTGAVSAPGLAAPELKPDVASAPETASRDTPNAIPAGGSLNRQHIQLASGMADIGYSDEAFERQIDTQTQALAQVLRLSFAENQEITGLDKDHPGFVQFLIDAMMPHLLDGVRDSLPLIRGRLSSIYAAKFTSDELQELLAFYNSKAGKKLLGAMDKRVDFAPMIDDVMKSEEGLIDKETFKAALGSAAVESVTNDLSLADTVALMKFARSPLFTKLQAANPQILSTVTHWMNEPMPEAEASAEEAMLVAIDEFLTAVEEDRTPVLPHETAPLAQGNMNK